MRPKALRQKELLRRETKRLSRNHFSLYGRVMARLLDSQRAHGFLKPLSDALRRKDWPEFYRLADLLSVQQYADADEHFVANQFALLVKKFPWDSKLVELDPERAAVKSFFSAEKRCGLINRKFDLLITDPSRDKFRAEGKLAMGWIRALLGSVPNYQRIAQQCDFGNGASVGIGGNATHIVRKLSDERRWTVTPGALHHAFSALRSNYHYFETLLESRIYGDGSRIVCWDHEEAFQRFLSRLDVVTNNKLSFVLKTAKTHRSIATEPVLNGLYQKGIDSEMRGKLLKFGIDLSDQSLNQQMAREGSLDDSNEGFVTIDLRGASNSNALGPVKYLYPPEWVRILDRTRSHYLSYRGAVKRYEMLCSMGNGFCFPVETITFAAICFACGCGVPGVDFMVYGDDIIVRKKHSVRVIAMLKHYGFSVNTEKTFIEGPFRESCGADWFNGADVRPFTLDFALDTVENFYKFLNLTQRSDRTSQFFAPVRTLVMSALSPQYLFIRPFKGEVDTAIDSLGDEHLSNPHCNCRFNNGTATWTWQELRHSPVIDFGRLQGREDEPWLMGVSLRGSKSIRDAPRIYESTNYLPEVALRYQTRTEITQKSYSSISNWLPTNYANVLARSVLKP